MKSSAKASSRPLSINPPAAKLLNTVKVRFSLQFIVITNPCLFRSSGKNPTPASKASVGLPARILLPHTLTSPLASASKPKIARATSLRPAPTNPAIPTTSPALTSNPTPRNLPGDVNPSTSKTTSPNPPRTCWGS